MKLTTILILATCLQAGVNGYSQGAVSAQPAITGRVADEEGSPIAGVSVLVKGTKTGTTTNDNGNFSIEAGIGDVLVFSSVSYGTREVKITSASIIIKLSLQVKPLEELVVSGNVVAVKRKADVSSITVLSGKDIEALPRFNLVNILEGVVPGVTKYNLNVDYQFHPNLRFFVQAQNFTNNTKPDFDKSFPVSGASWMFGLSLNFNKMTK